MLTCNGPDFRKPHAPLTADIVLKSTATTPWGTYTQTTKGKFWRTRDGKSRQDDSYGNSWLFVYPNEIWVDHQLKTARISISGSRDPFKVKPICRTGQQRGTLAGREVIGNSPGFWWDVEWGVVVQAYSKRPTLEIIQQLVHAEDDDDPDPELFKIPEGYTVITCIPSKKAPFPADCPEVLHGPLGPDAR